MAKCKTHSQHEFHQAISTFKHIKICSGKWGSTLYTYKAQTYYVRMQTPTLDEQLITFVITL
jgi:hypothetical protein